MKSIMFVLLAIICMPLMAFEFSVESLMTAYNAGSLTDYLAQFLIARISDHPVIALTLAGLTASQPLLALIANKTDNPHDNRALILINKVLQTLTYGTSKNQPDVPTWKELLTNKPSVWPELVEVKTVVDVMELSARLGKKNAA